MKVESVIYLFRKNRIVAPDHFPFQNSWTSCPKVMRNSYTSNAMGRVRIGAVILQTDDELIAAKLQ